MNQYREQLSLLSEDFSQASASTSISIFLRLTSLPSALWYVNLKVSREFLGFYFLNIIIVFPIPHFIT